MQDSKRLVNMLSEFWQVGVALFDFDSWTILYVTKRFTDLTGVSQADIDLYGKTIFQRCVDRSDFMMVRSIHQVALDAFYSKKYANVISEALINYNVRLRCCENISERFTFSLKVNSFSLPAEKIGLMVCQKEVKTGYERFSLTIPARNKAFFYSENLRKYVMASNFELQFIEKEILRLSASGFTEQRIAKSLNISIDLLRYYKKSIYSKLSVSSISSAVYVATHQELI
jgi:hypothetical protein